MIKKNKKYMLRYVTNMYESIKIGTQVQELVVSIYKKKAFIIFKNDIIIQEYVESLKDSS